MKAIPVTGMKFSNVGAIADSICPKNVVIIKKDVRYDKDEEPNVEFMGCIGHCDGMSYVVKKSDVQIGYIPLPRSVARDYARTEFNKEMFRALCAIRESLRVDFEVNELPHVAVPIHNTSYKSGGAYIEWDTYSQMSTEEAKKWSLSQISIGFEDIELW